MRIHRPWRLLWALTLALALFGVSLTCLAGEPLVNNVFDNTYIADVLRDISSQTGVPIIADVTVQGQVTLTLENVPLEQALTRVLAQGGFVFKNMGGYYLVGAPDAKNPSFAILSRTEAVKMRYVKADSAARLLNEAFTPYVKADKETNTVVVTAPDSILARIKSDLAVIDRQIPQIMIEAMVVDVSKEGRKELGLDWKWEHGGTESTGTSFLAQMLGMGGALEYIPANSLNKFLLSLKATVGNGNARVEANPRVATLDGQTAEIFVGRDRYYYLTETTDSDTTSRLESIKTGITLKLLPQVAENGEIIVHIEPEVSDVVSDTNGNGDLPVISRRHVNTTVRVKNGDSIVLGGLLQRVEHKVTTRVPVLGYLPVLNLLFSSTKTVHEEGEVLIIITPYLMDGADVGVSPRLMSGSLIGQ